jgi:hypothetical protein
MPDGDWVVALTGILGVILGVFGTAYFEYRRRTRKSAQFTMRMPEDLARVLRSHGNFEVKFEDLSTHELISAPVTVQNTGNVAINDFRFQLTVPGVHNLALAQASSDNPDLTAGIRITSSGQYPATDPTFDVHIPFFNPKENFRINMFFDGAMTTSIVSCRLPETSIEILTLGALEARSKIRSRYLLFAMLLVMAFTITFSSINYYRKYVELQRSNERNAELERYLAERRLQKAPQ